MDNDRGPHTILRLMGSERETLGGTSSAMEQMSSVCNSRHGRGDRSLRLGNPRSG